jgi:hypothetical protein
MVDGTGKLLQWLALEHVTDEDQWSTGELPMELPKYINPWYRNAIDLQ